jgi:hypothetical protein
VIHVKTLLLLSMVLAFTAASHGQNPAVLQLQPAGTGTIQGTVAGIPGAVQGVEIDPALDLDDQALPLTVSGGAVVNRTVATSTGIGPSAPSSKKAKSNPELITSFDGLNLFQQRFANGGNQFTVEPPDQALCVGNSFVLESVNDVIRVFDKSGGALVGVTDLNTFYGYPAAINRTTNPLQFGPEITDPVCYFDQQTQRWFHVVLTLDRVGTTSALAGPNHLDIAVSQTSSPLGAWTIYQLPVQNNGTQGTPDHQCAGGFCLGDYPHIGADANGIYLTTNEFALFAPGFIGAQIYAISKQALVTGSGLTALLFNTGDPSLNVLLDGAPGFTVWPATSPGTNSVATANAGTEYFLSSQAVFNNSGSDNRIRVWALSNTQSLNTPSPSLNLIAGLANVNTYAVPPKSNQAVGPYPQGQLLGKPEGILDSNDSRMQQVTFANGKLWGALDTAVTVGGQNKAGIAYYVLQPIGSAVAVSAKVVKQGVLALAANNVTYPAIGVTSSGRGVIAFTLTGTDYFPSAGYVGLDALAGAGPIHVAAAGLGPQDGFTEYSGRARWGDYGATAVDGTSIWIASEYIGQTCTVAQYLVDPTCGQTRAPLGNWGTRISLLVP